MFRKEQDSVCRQGRLFAPSFPTSEHATTGRRLVAAGLFAGIGGIELGLSRSGHRTAVFSEIDPSASEVLKVRFPGIDNLGDIRALGSLPKEVDLITAGFPCQDLSQAGLTAGLSGNRSSLVDEIFRILREQDIPWVLLENVSFMLRLQKGEALGHVITFLERLGYDWAYRVVDTRSAGLPQRRQRVYLLASKDGDPRSVLLGDDAGPPQKEPPERWRDFACGFYWTEGVKGLGWAIDAVPTLKAGSTVGIPSPPAVILPSGEVITPDIRDAERLQGFCQDWTKPAVNVARPSLRWKLVGNSVSVPVAAWIGARLVEPAEYEPDNDQELVGDTWPIAAWGIKGKRYASTVSAWPMSKRRTHLASFLRHEGPPLSERATRGFLARTCKSGLRFPGGFLGLLEDHLRHVQTVGA